MYPTFTQLERVVATAQYGSYSAAASELYISTQAVSRSVHELEQTLNVQLFESRGKRLQTTWAGAAVCRYAVDALEAKSGIKQVALNTVTRADIPCGSLAVAVANSPFRGRMFRQEDFAAFRRLYPRVRLKVLFFAGSGCLAALHEGMAAAALVAGKPDYEGLHSVKIRTITPQLLVSSHHELAGKSAATFADLHGRKLAVPHDFRCCKAVVEKRLAEQGIRPRFVAVEMSEARHRAFLDQGGALLVSNDEHLLEVFSDTTMIPFVPQDRIALPCYFVWRKSAETPEVALLRQCLRSAG